MNCFIELWNPTEAWKSLSKEERQEYLGQIGPHLQGLMEQGVEIISWGKNNKDTSHRAGFDYFAVWKFPSNEMAKEFENVVESAGWYNYFEQVNLSGESTTPDVIIGELIAI